MNSFDYQKPEAARWYIGRILGPRGLLVVEGENHKNQVCKLSPVCERYYYSLFHLSLVRSAGLWYASLSE
jgi:hypothetical protein